MEVVDPEPFDATFDAGVDAAEDVVTSGATGILAFDDFLACGVISGLAERGLSVPGDRSIVGCDDVLLAGRSRRR